MGKVQKSGHVQIYCGKKNGKEIWRYQHQLAMEKKLGHKLAKGVVIHHKDSNPSNNSASNLTLTTKAGHNKIDASHHNGGRRKGG